jgi:hypothetical protein
MYVIEPIKSEKKKFSGNYFYLRVREDVPSELFSGMNLTPLKIYYIGCYCFIQRILAPEI